MLNSCGRHPSVHNADPNVCNKFVLYSAVCKDVGYVIAEQKRGKTKTNINTVVKCTVMSVTNHASVMPLLLKKQEDIFYLLMFLTLEMIYCVKRKK
jgi:hypothetical protein